jgi:hypothetical protein
LQKLDEIILIFEKFMKKYDKGDDLNDIIISYYNGKTSVIEAINRNIYFEEFRDFEKLMKEQT